MNLTHDNVTQSVEEWALDYGISADLITLRIAAGWNTVDAIETEMPMTDKGARAEVRALKAVAKGAQPKVSRTPYRKLVTYNGESLTIPAWAKRFGIDATTLRWRLRRGWSVSRAMQSQDHRFENHGIRLRQVRYLSNGGRTLTLRQWSELVGVNLKTIRSRVHADWSAERVLATPTQRQHGGVGRAQTVNAGTGAHPAAKILAELGFLQ